MSIDQASRDEQVEYLARRFKIPKHEADTLLENMVREDAGTGERQHSEKRDE